MLFPGCSPTAAGVSRALRLPAAGCSRLLGAVGCLHSPALSASPSRQIETSGSAAGSSRAMLLRDSSGDNRLFPVRGGAAPDHAPPGEQLRAAGVCSAQRPCSCCLQPACSTGPQHPNPTGCKAPPFLCQPGAPFGAALHWLLIPRARVSVVPADNTVPEPVLERVRREALRGLEEHPGPPRPAPRNSKPSTPAHTKHPGWHFDLGCWGCKTLRPCLGPTRPDPMPLHRWPPAAAAAAAAANARANLCPTSVRSSLLAARQNGLAAAACGLSAHSAFPMIPGDTAAIVYVAIIDCHQWQWPQSPHDGLSLPQHLPAAPSR